MDMQNFSRVELEAIQILRELEEESLSTSAGNFPSSIYPRSTTFPPFSLCPQVDIFNKLVTEDLKKLNKNTNNHNLSLKQKKAIEELKALEGVVIKPADKGGNVVVWPIQMYEREVFRQLRDQDTYTSLSGNPTKKFESELEDILEAALLQGVITKKVYDGLHVKFPVMPTFYLLPKIHKNPSCPPGRPIVSGIGGLCDAICKFIEFYLHPLVETLPSYVRDTSDVLRRIDGIILESGVLLVAVDVETLYSCIRHRDGLAASRFFLSMSNWDTDMQTLILELLEFILTHNYFLFKDWFFLQKRGTAMGAACAPSYANLFLGLWEREVFSGGVCAASQAQCWVRYIDDIFIIWRGTDLELRDFLVSLNCNDLNIRLTYTWSPVEIKFLDIKVTIESDMPLQTEVFRKQTSVNSLLHATSSHLPSTIKAIPVGQFLRVRRICSFEESFERQSGELRDRFRDRGYGANVIKRGYLRAKATSRTQLLSCAKRKKQSDNTIRFITTYNNQWFQIRKILTKHWSVLQLEPSFKNVLPDFPALTARKSKNLKDHLVHIHYVCHAKLPFDIGPPKWGCFPCGSCLACCNIERAKTFMSADGQKSFEVRHYISCSTEFVIYAARCGCGLIYVGLTSRQFRIRVRERYHGSEGGV
ncbi:uncharacterized protein ACNLHF_002507 [Anomaloglossus baeobatrachus]|uniref:uncharacterized protein LOC142256296 n=1 Tax=Anomaloglossus baeobatrachus TaxID=238106 RepID=UPI003F4FAA25